MFLFVLVDFVCFFVFVEIAVIAVIAVVAVIAPGCCYWAWLSVAVHPLHRPRGAASCWLQAFG